MILLTNLFGSEQSHKNIMIKLLFLSALGLCSLPFLSVILQFLDMKTGFGHGYGFHTNSLYYITESPLVFLLCYFIVCILIGVLYFLRLNFRKKKETREEDNL